MTPAPIRTLVVDDEPLARAGIIDLAKRDAELEVVGECANGRDAVASVMNLRPDLLILDVQMPELDGFEVVRAVGVEQMPVVIFITAYDQFALRAFEVNAVDYLLKPFEDERFQMAVDRAKRLIRQSSLGDLGERLLALVSSTELASATSDTAGGGVTRFLVREAGRVQFIPTRDVDWIEGADYYVKLHVAERVYLLRESLTSLAARLDVTRFCRVHRSAIVNLSRVRQLRISDQGGGILVLADGTRLKLARGKRVELEARLERVRDDR